MQRGSKNSFIKKGGWATFPGTASPNNNVAEACAKMLNELKYPRRSRAREQLEAVSIGGFFHFKPSV